LYAIGLAASRFHEQTEEAPDMKMFSFREVQLKRTRTRRTLR
jgi:hypothetical protein